MYSVQILFKLPRNIIHSLVFSVTFRISEHGDPAWSLCSSCHFLVLIKCSFSLCTHIYVSDFRLQSVKSRMWAHVCVACLCILHACRIICVCLNVLISLCAAARMYVCADQSTLTWPRVTHSAHTWVQAAAAVRLSQWTHFSLRGGGVYTAAHSSKKTLKC